MSAPNVGAGTIIVVVPNRIFVGGISHDTTETDLMIAFSAYGTVMSTRIIMAQDGFNKGYGFVTFQTEKEAQRLQSLGESVVLRNRLLNIAPAFRKLPVLPKLQPIIDTNGGVYFTGQPPPSVPATANYPQAPAATDYSGAAGSAIYQQAPASVLFQPVYQYYSVPINVPSAWPQTYQ